MASGTEIAESSIAYTKSDGAPQGSKPSSSWNIQEALQLLWDGFLSFFPGAFLSNSQNEDVKPSTRQSGVKEEDSSVQEEEEEERFQKAAQDLIGTTSASDGKNTSYTQVPYCRQLESWDCGVACLQMVLAWLRDYPSACDTEERQWMLDTLGTESIWTIDLILLLDSMIQKQHSYLLCSKLLGVDREHHSLHYYEKAFGRDQVRVNRLFEKATSAGLPLLCVSHLDFSKVLELVAYPRIVAIVLLDNSILLQRGENAQYAGHYVVLVGMSTDPVDVERARERDPISNDDFCLVVKNPGGKDETDFVTPSLLERSWRATGTDDDIIFIAKQARTEQE